MEVKDMKQELFDLAIVLPIYNTEKYIKQCMDSILCQMKKNIELIIVNDGCTDSSLEIIHSLSLPQNVVIINKNNEGRFWAKVDGMRFARAKYIGFIDSDDYIEENMFDKMLKLALEEKSDIVECLVDPFSDSSKVQEQVRIIQKRNIDLQKLGHKRLNKEDILRAYFLEQGISPFLWDKIFSRHCINLFLKYMNRFNNIRDQFIGNPVDDIYITPALLMFANSLSVCPERLYHYRIMSDNSFNREIEDDYNKKINIIGYRSFEAFGFIENMLIGLHMSKKIKNLHFVFLAKIIENFYDCCIKNAKNTRKSLLTYKKVWKKNRMFRYTYYAFCQRCYYEKRKMNKKEKVCLLKILIY